MIRSGTEWANVIDANLEQSKIVLLLVSSDFMDSDYCWEIELKKALERHAQKAAVVLPIIVRDCQWSSAPFAKLQALPHKAKSWTSGRTRTRPGALWRMALRKSHLS
jgi:hypothetical protein